MRDILLMTDQEFQNLGGNVVMHGKLAMNGGILPVAELSFETNPYLKRIKDTYLLNLRSILGVADKHEFGILAANCIRPEITRRVLRAAFDLNSHSLTSFRVSVIMIATSG